MELFKEVQLLCTLLHAHHYKSSPHSHHWIELLYPFALPHLPFKRLSFLNLESLHLSYFSCLWKEDHEEKTFVSSVLPCSEVQCLWPSFPVIGHFHCELKSQRGSHVPARHLQSLFSAPGNRNPEILCCLSVLLSAYSTYCMNGVVSFSVSLLKFGYNYGHCKQQFFFCCFVFHLMTIKGRSGS